MAASVADSLLAAPAANLDEVYSGVVAEWAAVKVDGHPALDAKKLVFYELVLAVLEGILLFLLPSLRSRSSIFIIYVPRPE